MQQRSFGFIGAGRVARILLGGFRRVGRMPGNIVAADTDQKVLEKLIAEFPEVTPALNGNRVAATQEIVFLALHPPAISQALEEIEESLQADAILISLAPRWTLARLAEKLGGFPRITRMIPNAPSLVNDGFNPVAFAPAYPVKEREEILTFLRLLGECPQVSEEKLEAYAMLTAMGPTYFWFQMEELASLGGTFGLSEEEAWRGIVAMTEGSAYILRNSGLSPEQIMDLVPVKPLAEDEDVIRSIYRNRLEPLFRKIRPQ
ncbi:MAG: NAD(P)-binding domain-containing protein [Coprothermobacterota bacterium]|nr:NAD(P)-binding domain-containing protein [Coprothermobacterota bacterium]